MKVTKLDAAIRQLMTALELFIEDKDPVSITTLAGNAWGKSTAEDNELYKKVAQ